MSIQFKNGMTVEEINEQLEKRVNNSSSNDVEIKNLYKMFNSYPFNFSEEGQLPILTANIICNFLDLRNFYIEWEENINDTQ